MQHFVRVHDGRFVVNCRTLFVSGWNHWELLEAAAGGLELFGASLPPNTTGARARMHALRLPPQPVNQAKLCWPMHALCS